MQWWTAALRWNGCSRVRPAGPTQGLPSVCMHAKLSAYRPQEPALPTNPSPPRQTSTRLTEEQAEHVERVRLAIGPTASTSDAVRRIVSTHRVLLEAGVISLEQDVH